MLQARRSSLRDCGEGSAGELGPGMYDTGRYHMYMKKHAACPTLNPCPELHSKGGSLERNEDDVDRPRDEFVDEPEHEEAASSHPESKQRHQETGPRDHGATSTAAGSSSRKGEGRRKASIGGGKNSSNVSTPALFKDAHRVHPKPNRPGSAPPSQGTCGTSAFKVIQREVAIITSIVVSGRSPLKSFMMQ